MQGEQSFKQRVHNEKQAFEKKAAKKRREEHRNYDSYPSSKYAKRQEDE